MKFITISFVALTLIACNESAAVKPDASTATANTSTSTKASLDNGVDQNTLESDSSEGVVGPDDAYFAGVYLESVFKASRSNPSPALTGGFSLAREKVVEAFDFAANLQPKRLGLMSRIVLELGDKDSDKALSAEEFKAVQLIPELKGGEAIGHEFSEELFKQIAGEDELLSHEEIKEMLAKLADQSQLAKLSKNEIRKALESGWEKVLLSFDENKDGKVSLEEQRKLRKERASIIGRFAE